MKNEQVKNDQVWYSGNTTFTGGFSPYYFQTPLCGEYYVKI